MSAANWLLMAIAAARLAELGWGRANTRRLVAMGAVEAGAGHYPAMVVLHTAWLAGLAVRVIPGTPLQPEPLVLLGLLVCGRAWVLASLGRRWTTRILILPEAPLVHRGPYRWLRHPNYLVVAGELAVVPLVFGAADLAMAFSALNGAMLAHRITVENAALNVRGTTAATE
jgi:methyltransferase